MSAKMRFTTKDLETFPDPINGMRYEIIDGELYISKQPHWNHQGVGDAINIRGEGFWNIGLPIGNENSLKCTVVILLRMNLN
jgi:hypothetical protein